MNNRDKINTELLININNSLQVMNVLVLSLSKFDSSDKDSLRGTLDSLRTESARINGALDLVNEQENKKESS
jgi:uncharacterized protein YfkK (UPF0435 family)